MILYDRSEAELNRIAEEYMKNTAITNYNTPGSRARFLLGIFNKILRSYYATLDFNLTMAFVSKATGHFLEEIGFLLNCQRLQNETDENYRYRITHQVEKVAGANETAIRLAALSVDHVVNVHLRRFTFGTGSFSVHIIADSLANLEQTVLKVQAALDEAEAYGVKGIALAPKVLSTKLELVVGFAPDVQNKEGISQQIKRVCKNRIDSLAMGEELIITDLIHDIRSAGGNSVKDCSIDRIEINGKPVMIYNYKPYWDEKLYTAEIVIR